jgi:osmotically-inducible protein OsmY
MNADRQLQRAVLDELQWEPSVDATEIAVTAKDGVVVLSGYVPVYAQKFVAEAAVKRVHGVKAIANDIEVRLAGSDQRTDADIATAVVNALKWDVAVPDEPIQVTVRDGWITLGGVVDWQYQKEAASRAARHLIGARGVTNSILVKPRAGPKRESTAIEARIRDAFLRSAVLDSKKIRAETRDGTVILRGEVHSHMERDDAERVAWTAPGVTKVDNCITITPWEG